LRLLQADQLMEVFPSMAAALRDQDPPPDSGAGAGQAQEACGGA
jgi:hypothetical protein